MNFIAVNPAPSSIYSFGLNDGPNNIVLNNGTAMPLNTWSHFVGTYNGVIAKLYKDGNLIASYNTNISFVVSTQPFYFGKEFNTTGRFFKGQIDDVGMWNRALTQNEITQLYTASPCVTYQTITVTDTLIINANLTGINPVTFQNSIKVYPNPTSSQISIDFGSNYSTLSGYSMRIDNATGQTVYTTPVNQQLYTSNLSTWTGNGLYLVYLLNPQGSVVDVRKIIIQ